MLLNRLGILNALIMNCMILHAESIPAIIIENTLVDVYYNLSTDTSITGKTVEDVCDAIGLPTTDVPGGYWCLNPWNNPVYVQKNYICSDGSIKVAGRETCEVTFPTCPNSSWMLSDDKTTCSRPDFSCKINLNEISEEKLLAGIAYGESSIRNSYEEMAGIASAIIRRRDAARLKTVNSLVNKYKKFTYVITDGNDRFRKIMCATDKKGFELAYKAASNALEGGEDFSNGGCFWDGYDLKISGSHHPKYISGFKFTDPGHNIFSTSEPMPRKRKTNKGSYEFIYESTAAHGGTIFWHLNDAYLKAEGKKQCM